MKFSIFALAAISSYAFAAPCATESASSTAVASSTEAATEAASSTSAASATSVAVAAASAGVEAASTTTPVGYASLNGGTTGGSGGTTTTVSSLAEFTAAVTGDDAAVVYVSGTITGAAEVRVGSNKSIIGLNSESGLTGVGLYIKGVSNVIVQNMKISKVLAENGDAIGIQASTNVWVDHCDLSSDTEHDKDYYDGLCDITHASDFVTVSNTYFHDHWKVSLVGHSDSNGDEDTGFLHVTYANNYWLNVNSRLPSIRFGTGHMFNSYFDTGDTGINTRMGAQVLVESSVFTGVTDAVTSQDSDDVGYAVVNDVDFGDSSNTAPAGTLTSVPYTYSLLGSASVKAAVIGAAGNTLTLG